MVNHFYCFFDLKISRNKDRTLSWFYWVILRFNRKLISSMFPPALIGSGDDTSSLSTRVFELSFKLPQQLQPGWGPEQPTDYFLIHIQWGGQGAVLVHPLGPRLYRYYWRPDRQLARWFRRSEAVQISSYRTCNCHAWIIKNGGLLYSDPENRTLFLSIILVLVSTYWGPDLQWTRWNKRLEAVQLSSYKPVTAISVVTYSSEAWS